MTLFGPPTTLKHLFKWSTELEDIPQIKTDARGGVHMENMPEVDVDKILGSSQLLDLPVQSNAIIVSPYNCKPRAARTLRELLAEIIPDVAQRPLQLSSAIDATIKLMQDKALRVVIPGYTSHELYLQKMLEKNFVEYSIVSHHESIPMTSPPGRDGSGLIAIVGMSGRFPGSGNVNAYWESLLQGKRYVQEVTLLSKFSFSVTFELML